MDRLQLKIGKTYKTYCDKKALVVDKLKNGCFVIYYYTCEKTRNCNEIGCSFDGCLYNLKEEWKEPVTHECWLNVWVSGFGTCHQYKEKAERVFDNKKALIHVVYNETKDEVHAEIVK